jgi:hypothetical protein
MSGCREVGHLSGFGKEVFYTSREGCYIMLSICFIATNNNITVAEKAVIMQYFSPNIHD